MTRSDTWSAGWVSEKISHNKVSSAIVVGPNLIAIKLVGVDAPLKVATISVDPVTITDLREVLIDDSVEFVMNTKKDALITGEAIEFAENKNFGLGTFGDLYAAINWQDLRNYISNDMQFVFLGLKQHTHVESVKRLNNKVYQVTTRALPQATILVLNDYDLTAASVRNGLGKFGRCDIILTSNPYCRTSPESRDAAESCGVRVLSWKQLLGALSH